MSYQGRSLDDQPLAAYSTGVAPDEAEDEAPPEPTHLSQQDVVAIAMGLDQPPPAPEPDAAPRRRRGLPRLSLPRPRVPKLSLPSRASAAPSMAAAGSIDVMAPPPSMAPRPAMAPRPLMAPPPAAAPARFAATAAASPALPPLLAPDPVETTAAPVRAARTRGPRLPGLGGIPRTPRAAVRDPRVLAGLVIVVGVAVLIFSLLGGGGPLGGGGAVDASPSPVAPVVAPPGVASLTLTGGVVGEHSLTGSTGTGRPAGDHLDSSWTDLTGSSLALAGRAGSGTRTTAEDLVLTLTVAVDGRPVTFTSDDGECTVGMAVQAATVRGSFVCKDLASDDGKVVVKATGTYQT